MATKKYIVSGEPYAIIYGALDIPEETIKQGKDAIRDYVVEHFDDINFGWPEFDYRDINYNVCDEHQKHVVTIFSEEGYKEDFKGYDTAIELAIKNLQNKRLDI